MPARIHGTAKAQQTLEGELDTFTMYVSAPCAIDPENTGGVNIRVTGSLADESQLNFEVLVQTIGLRAVPVSMDDPIPTANLVYAGAPSLHGQGFVWTFAVESADVFSIRSDKGDDPVGLLVEELNGIVMPNGVVLDTKSHKKNVEVVKIKNAR